MGLSLSGRFIDLQGTEGLGMLADVPSVEYVTIEFPYPRMVQQEAAKLCYLCGPRRLTAHLFVSSSLNSIPVCFDCVREQLGYETDRQTGKVQKDGRELRIEGLTKESPVIRIDPAKKLVYLDGI